MEDETLQYFNTMYDLIPQMYKQIPKDYYEDEENKDQGKYNITFIFSLQTLISFIICYSGSLQEPKAQT